jgi:hypothetical protein
VRDDTGRWWRVEVGAIPPASLRGNSRAHWRVKHRDGKTWRESGYMHGLTMTADPPLKRIRITFKFHHWRKIDLDNLGGIGMKPWVDGLVDAGVVVDDDPDHLDFGTHQFERCAKGESRTEVLVKELT